MLILKTSVFSRLKKRTNSDDAWGDSNARSFQAEEEDKFRRCVGRFECEEFSPKF
jgi:hypothetical protein